MVLRRATTADLPYILQLEGNFCELGFVGADDAVTYEHRLGHPDCRYSIVEVDSAPAGYVILRGLVSRNACVELKRLVIAEPGCGLGRQVLEAILETAFGELSAHRLWLDVFEDNSRARHLYRSAGFVEEGTLRECVRYGAEYRSLV